MHRLGPGLKQGLRIRIRIDPHYFGKLDSGSGSKVKIQEPCRAVNSYNGGIQDQNEALEGL